MVESFVTESVTKQEIAYYWKQKRIVEEDHLYAAIKAAARLRTRDLTVGDYLKFKHSLEADDEIKENENNAKLCDKTYDKETRVGIKDWWTKSRYAYLNQPAVKSYGNLRRRSNSCAYLPQFFAYKSTSLRILS